MQIENHESNVRLKLPNSIQELQFESEVLEIFKAHRQTDQRREIGGMLFAEFDLPLLRVVEATVDKKGAFRTKVLFWPDRIRQANLIKKRFKSGLHFIGEWHSHPTRIGVPSNADLDSMEKTFCQSNHQLNWFVMIIVGNDVSKLEMTVSLHQEDKWILV